MTIAKTSEKPHKCRRWWCWVRGIAVAILLSIAVGFGWLHYQTVVGEREFHEHLAAIRARDEPVRPTDVDWYYELPPSAEDMTTLWLGGATPIDPGSIRATSILSGFLIELGDQSQQFPIVGYGDTKAPAVDEPWPELESAEQLLHLLKKPLGLIYEAAQRGGKARFQLDFDKGMALPTPHLYQLRRIADVLSLEAHVHAHRDRPAAARQSIHTIFMAARSLKHEPLLISQLIRSNIQRAGRELFQQLLSTTEFSDDDLRLIQSDLQEVDLHDGLRRALIGERLLGIEIFAHPKNLTEFGGGDDDRFFTRITWRAFRRNDFSFYVAFMEELIAATNKPWPKAIANAQQVRDQLDRAVKNDSGFPQAYYMTGLLIPDLEQYFVAIARAQGHNDSADVAIAIEFYRRKNGNVPTNLADLVPEFLPAVPTDPFDGQPLRYRLSEKEYVVYSVGPDLKDDGGLEGPDATNADIVFSVRLKSVKKPSNPNAVGK